MDIIRNTVNDVIRLWLWMTFPAHRLLCAIRVTAASRIADRTARRNCEIVRVVANNRHELEVWTDSSLRGRRRSGQIPKTWGPREIDVITFYIGRRTPSPTARKAARDRYDRYMSAVRRRQMDGLSDTGTA